MCVIYNEGMGVVYRVWYEFFMCLQVIVDKILIAYIVKTAELYLDNNSVTTTNYIKYINSIHCTAHEMQVSM